MGPGPRPSFFPPPAEVAWYALLRKIRSWAERLPEQDVVVRSERLAARFAALAGRPPGPFMAMGRGLAQALHVRLHGATILEKLDAASVSRWESFARRAGECRKAIFAGAHLGPFELQMDLLGNLPHQILFLYRSYRWPPLARLVAGFRRRAGNLSYLEFRQSREILRTLKNGHSLALLADQSPSGRALPVFGRRVLDAFPVRAAIREGIPLFVGGIFNHAQPQRRPGLGFDYYEISTSDPADACREYAAAFEKTIRNNPSDWIYFS